jgi:hypothetical protein
MSPETQNELITLVSECMMNEIKKEVSEAEFVALLMEQHIYLWKHKCLLFSDTCARMETLKKGFYILQISMKIIPQSVAQTYDGTAVMMDDHMR